MATILFGFKNCEFGGGAEKNMLEVAKHAAMNHKVCFIITGGYVDPIMTAIGRVYKYPSHGRKIFFILDLIYQAYIILTERIDIIHAHHRYPAFLASLVLPLMKVKLITTVHNRFPDKAGISLWGDRAIAVSQGVADWMIDECSVPKEKVRVIHNGIKTPNKYPQDELAALKKELDILEYPLILCSVGRLTKQKNYSCLIDALAKKNNIEWALLLVGEGEDRSTLEKQVTILGIEDRVRFLGHRKDVDRIMQLSDIFVMSSLWEGFPYVVIEALANGLPIVSTNVGGVAEGVIENVTGFLVSSGDTHALSEKIGILISDPELRLSFAKNGKIHFNKYFQDKTMMASVDREYAALLAKQ